MGGFLALILSHIRSFSTVQSIRISRSYKKRHIVDQYKKKRKNVTYANLLKFEMRLVLPVPMKAIFFTLECKHSGEACLHHWTDQRTFCYAGCDLFAVSPGQSTEKEAENEIYKGPSVLLNIVHSELRHPNKRQLKKKMKYVSLIFFNYIRLCNWISFPYSN